MDDSRRKTACVAIVGADGSGKTTVAHEIIARSPQQFRYVYMGPAIGSANYALPTSRLLNYLKRRKVRDLVDDEQSLPPSELMSDVMRKRIPVRGRIFKALGLINRIAEEWYRQLVVLIFRIRGFSVLCDRHFLFEYCPDSTLHQAREERLSVRAHRRMLSRFYPPPHLVIHLYASPEVLHERTPEWNIDYLIRQQQGIREQGGQIRCYVEVDASKPLEEVIGEVQTLIDLHLGERTLTQKGLV